VQGFGVPSERYGEEVMVWVRRAEGAAITPARTSTPKPRRIAFVKDPEGNGSSSLIGTSDDWFKRQGAEVPDARVAVEELGLGRAAGIETA